MSGWISVEVGEAAGIERDAAAYGITLQPFELVDGGRVWRGGSRERVSAPALRPPFVWREDDGPCARYEHLIDNASLPELEAVRPGLPRALVAELAVYGLCSRAWQQREAAAHLLLRFDAVAEVQALYLSCLDAPPSFERMSVRHGTQALALRIRDGHDGNELLYFDDVDAVAKRRAPWRREWRSRYAPFERRRAEIVITDVTLAAAMTRACVGLAGWTHTDGVFSVSADVPWWPFVRRARDCADALALEGGAAG